MKYEIIGRFIELHEGLIEVNEAQARRRITALSLVGGDIYRIDKPVQFKVGEIVGINYDPPKSLVDFMKPLELPEIEEVIELPEITVTNELPEIEEVATKRPKKFR